MNFENIINGLTNAAGAVENDLAAISGQPENAGTVSVGKVSKYLVADKNRDQRVDLRTSDTFKEVLNKARVFGGQYATQSDFINYLLADWVQKNKKFYNTLNTQQKKLVKDKFYTVYYKYFEF